MFYNYNINIRGVIVIENNSISLIEKENITNYNAEDIKSLIYCIRGKQVMLDSDVAKLYHYPTKRINESVTINKQRFPENFCFQLTEEEYESLRYKNFTLNNFNSQGVNENNFLRSQIATLKV